MKEFNHNFVIEFSHNGERIRHRVEVKNVTCHRKRGVWLNWDYRFVHNGVKYTVNGSIDSDGDIRTDGAIDKYGHMARFYVTAGRGEVIDDIDIVATDEDVLQGSVFITVRLDFEYTRQYSEKEAAEEILEDVNYDFRSPGWPGARLPRVISTEICGINE